jgi:hypothetical protein
VRVEQGQGLPAQARDPRGERLDLRAEIVAGVHNSIDGEEGFLAAATDRELR